MTCYSTYMYIHAYKTYRCLFFGTKRNAHHMPTALNFVTTNNSDLNQQNGTDTSVLFRLAETKSFFDYYCSCRFSRRTGQELITSSINVHIHVRIFILNHQMFPPTTVKPPIKDPPNKDTIQITSVQRIFFGAPIMCL